MWCWLKTPLIIKLETSKEIHLLRSIRELKWLVVVGIRLCTFSFHTVLVLQPSYLFLQWTFGVCHKYFTFTVFSGYSSLRISMLFLNCHLHSMAFMTSSIYLVDDCYKFTLFNYHLIRVTTLAVKQKCWFYLIEIRGFIVEILLLC